MPKYAKIDDNQRVIVSALRDAGAAVQSLASVGHGTPDLLVAFRGKWFIAEVKDGRKPPSKRALTGDEADWHLRFRDHAQVHIWTSVDDALIAIGAMKPGLVKKS